MSGSYPSPSVVTKQYQLINNNIYLNTLSPSQVPINCLHNIILYPMHYYYQSELIMIQKARVYPELQYPPSKFALDPFQNPYLPKLAVKLTPKPTPHPYALLSPLSPHRDLNLAQAIPVYRSDTVRVALLWRTYLTTRYARAHFGVSYEYKLYEDLRIKSRVLAGSSLLVDIQVSKYLGNTEVSLGYSGLLEGKELYNSLSAGVKKGMFAGSVTKKIMSDTEAKVSVNHQLRKDLYLQAAVNTSIANPASGEVQLSLRHSIRVIATPYHREVGMKVELQRNITKNQRVVVSSEYLDGKSVVYLGVKNLNFNFVFPCFIADGPLPFLAGIAAYAAAYLYSKNSKWSKAAPVQGERKAKKTEEKRLDELKLIGDKAADQYERERQAEKGLTIEEAYVGPADQIEQFMQSPRRNILILRDEAFQGRFFDLTVTLRFYVMKGELKLRKGDKMGLLGYYSNPNESNRIVVRYRYKNETRTVFFDEEDALVLPLVAGRS